MPSASIQDESAFLPEKGCIRLVRRVLPESGLSDLASGGRKGGGGETSRKKKRKKKKKKKRKGAPPPPLLNV